LAYTTEHHLVNMSRAAANMIAAPVKAVFINGPKAVKNMHQYEVRDREKPENRDLLRHRLFAIVSAPAVETKAIIDGVVSSVTFAGKFLKEFLSIPFAD
jgi:phosphoribosylformylglycinamidine (FGAM) synthase-like enzyme